MDPEEPGHAALVMTDNHIVKMTENFQEYLTFGPKKTIDKTPNCYHWRKQKKSYRPTLHRKIHGKSTQQSNPGITASQSSMDWISCYGSWPHWRAGWPLIMASNIGSRIYRRPSSGQNQHFYWFLSRATAIVAYLLLWLNMTLGVGITSKLAKVFPGGAVSADRAPIFEHPGAWLCRISWLDPDR